MGLDVSFWSLRPEAFSGAEIFAALREGAIETTPSYVVDFGDGSSGEVWGAGKPDIGGLVLSHFHGRSFLDRVLRVSDRFDCCLAWEEVTCVTRGDLVPLVPEEVTQAWGKPVVLRDTQHFNEILGGRRL